MGNCNLQDSSSLPAAGYLAEALDLLDECILIAKVENNLQVEEHHTLVLGETQYINAALRKWLGMHSSQSYMITPIQIHASSIIWSRNTIIT